MATGEEIYLKRSQAWQGDVSCCGEVHHLPFSTEDIEPCFVLLKIL